VALLDGLLDEPELAVLQIADAAMDHVAGRRGRTRCEVIALDQQHVDALHREVTERGDAVDSRTDDDNARAAALSCGADVVAFERGRGGSGHVSLLAGPSRYILSVSAQLRK